MVDEFDKLYVVSDLHLGGPVGKRACRETPTLVKLIEIATRDPANRVALVLNGDIFDFLAIGPNAKEFNPHPERVLREMGKDAEYKQLFDALGSFVREVRERRLILQLGNHDIELCLPQAQETMLELMQVTEVASRNRVRFETSGAGWACKVGPRLILVVHGNAWDPWNVVDPGDLDRAVQAAIRGAVQAPSTNAGTTMVCRVINKIKDDQPFVDLLKPEDKPLMAVLAAVDAPTSYLGLATALARRMPEGQYGELLGTGQAPQDQVEGLRGPDAEIADLLESASKAVASGGAEVLLEAEENLELEKRVRDLVPDDLGQLGYARDYARVGWKRLLANVAKAKGQPVAASLRTALKEWLADDTSFAIDQLSDIDRRIRAAAPDHIDLVIAGHTHLPRSTPRYINTGTWMRVLKLNDSNYMASAAQFQTFFDVVKRRHTLDELDALRIDPRLRPVAVVDSASAGLFRVEEDGQLTLL